MKVATFQHITHTIPHHHTVEWEDLPSLLSALPEGHLWCPFSFREGQARGRRTTESSTVFVADFDNVTKLELEQADHFVKSRNLAHIWHDTKSSTVDAPRRRLIILLDRPVSGGEWAKAWTAMSKCFPRLDIKCKDSSRMYFASKPASLTCGEPWKWEAETLGREAIALTERRLAGRTGLVDALTCALRDVLDGKPWAQEGNRDDMLFRLVTQVNRFSRSTPPEAIAEAFRASVAAMNDPDFTLDLVLSKVQRTRENLELEAREAEERAEADRVQQQQAMLAAQGRTGFMSPEEKAELARRYGYESMDHRWVIQLANVYYVMGPLGVYIQRSSTDIKAALPQDLAAAGLELYRPTKSGMVLKQPHEIVTEYGCVAEGTIVDLCSDKAYYDVVERKFVEAPIKRPPFEPVYHEDVHEWLSVLTEHPEQLFAWIQFVTRLDRACVALALIGAKGTGKSLLACGLAQLFGQNAPTDIKTLYDGMGNMKWTSSIMKCPLLLGDEELPKRGRDANTEACRELIQLRTIPLKRHYQPDTQMRGSIRLIVAANNDKIFANSGDSTQEDFEATAERFLMLNVPRAAAEYLSRFTAEELEMEWKMFKIAEHALWLRDNNGAVPDGRFMIRTNADVQGRIIANQSGPVQVMRELIGRVLAQPRLAGPLLKFTTLDDNGWHVSTAFVDKVWELYFEGNSVKKPSAANIAKSLGSLGERTGRISVEGGFRPYVFTLSEEVLGHALTISGLGGMDDVTQAVERLHEERYPKDHRKVG